MNKKMGFTLLELLTVVMIIATLTAIAVPQYRRTIRRSQAAEGLMNLRTIYEAASRYKAQYSKPPTNVQQLDVGFFDALKTASNVSVIGNFRYIFSDDSISACRLYETAGSPYCFEVYYNNPDYGGRGAITCNTQGEVKDPAAVCSAFGTPYEDSSTVYIVDGM